MSATGFTPSNFSSVSFLKGFESLGSYMVVDVLVIIYSCFCPFSLASASVHLFYFCMRTPPPHRFPFLAVAAVDEVAAGEPPLRFPSFFPPFLPLRPSHPLFSLCIPKGLSRSRSFESSFSISRSACERLFPSLFSLFHFLQCP